MTKEGMNHAPTDAEIDAAILKGAEVAGEEARKGLGLPAEAPVVGAVPEAKPAVVEAAPKTEKTPEKVRSPKNSKSTSPMSATGAGRNRSGRVGKKVAKKISQEIAAETGSGTIVEEENPEARPVSAGFPEWGVSRDSVYESRMIIPMVQNEVLVEAVSSGMREEKAPAAVAEAVADSVSDGGRFGCWCGWIW